MPIPRMSEAEIRLHAAPGALARGERFAQSGAVLELVLRGSLLTARVEDSADVPCSVSVSFDSRSVLSVSCTCGQRQDGWCAHAVAVLQVAINEPDEIEERPVLDTLLEGLDRDQLQVLLLRLAGHFPDLAEALDREVALLRAAPSKPAPPAPPPSLIDPRPFRRQARQILQNGGYGGQAALGLLELVEQALEIGRAGDWRGALVILEALTDECIESLEALAEEENDLGDLFNELGQPWAIALLSAHLTDDERRDWRDELAEWRAAAEEYGSGEGLAVAELAAEQGWEAPELHRALAGELAGQGPALDQSPLSLDLNRLRLQVLDLQGRTQEYLFLAETAGLATHRAVMLVRLGHHQEALALALRELTQAGEAFELARAMHDWGHLDLALRVGEHGLGLQEPRAPLADWLVDLAATHGRADLALRAAEVAFRSAPSLAAYQRVRDLAGPRWGELREPLLALLRTGRASWQTGLAAVAIFLDEGLVDEAIGLVDQGLAPDMLPRVVEAATESRPDWVIRTATRRAEAIMEPGRATHYGEAISWLRHARAAYHMAGREADWSAYLNGVRGRYARKYKLMELIQQMERRG